MWDFMWLFVIFKKSLAQNLFEEQFLPPTRFSPVKSISQNRRESRVRRYRSRRLTPSPLTFTTIL
jgi:hypothetical protein